MGLRLRGDGVTAYLVRRLMQGVGVVFALTLIVFFGLHVIGNPVDLLIPPDCTLECFRQAERELGVDRGIVEQYFVFLTNLAEGNLGRSFVNKVPPMDLVLARIPATLELAATAVLITVAVGIPLGVWAGVAPNSVAGRTIMGGSILGFSLPTFWVGLLFIMVFSVELGWLPSTGRGKTATLFGVQWSFLTVNGLSHLVMPAVTMALFHIAMVIRLTQSGMREVMLSDYVRFARAKGLPMRRILFVHALKNALIPIVTVVGLEIGFLVAFAVVVETIFAWPGMGKLLIDSINLLDRPVILAYLMLIAFLFIVINLVVDVLYSMLDPRVRLYGARE